MLPVVEQYEEETIDLRELWRAILRRKWMLIAIFMAAVISAAVASYYMTPIYEATTSILVQDPNSNPGALAFLQDFGSVGKNTNQNYVEVLKSRTIAMRAAEKMGRSYDLYSPEFAAFKGSIAVQLVQGTDAIRINVQGPDPAETRDTANAVVAAFIDYNQSINSEEAYSARVFIEEQLKNVEAELAQAEEALRSYKEEKQVFAPSEEAKEILSRVSTLEGSLAGATVSLDEVEHQLAELHRKLQGEAPTTTSATTITTNPVVSQLRMRLVDLESELAVVQQQYSASHPQVSVLNTQIEQARSQIAQEVERIVSTETISTNPNYQSLAQRIVSLEVDRAALQAKGQALQLQISLVEKSLAALPQKEVELTRLVRNQSVLEQIYILLKNKYEEYRITEAVKASGVSIIDAAVTPKNAIKPSKKMNVAIAGFLGLFVGVGLIFLLEFLDTTLKSEEDVERYLGLPVLGRIPEVSGNQGRKLNKAQRATS